ncbi:MAG: ABC transporter ATP-binding protein [Beijerinckiaceae bacterium]|nr:ABC transporter ATP-binding protein [Beijerinckiaceae bacterium]
MARISLRNVSVELAIYNPRGRALKNELLRRTIGGGVRDDRDRAVITVNALKNVSFEARDGDRIGLIGNNGAGKTTLLRVLSKVYPPTGGVVEIQGRVSSLIDLAMGMDMEATGYENIVMRGVMLGLDHKQARSITEDVETFSQLGQYLSLPIRTYSSGMLLRLAFAVSTAVQPEIAIFDEIIGVGDAGFAARAKKRIHQLIQNSNIMFLASHDNGSIQSFCNRVLWLRGGEIVMDGPPPEVLGAYDDAIAAADEIADDETSGELPITGERAFS